MFVILRLFKKNIAKNKTFEKVTMFMIKQEFAYIIIKTRDYNYKKNKNCFKVMK